MVIGEKFVWCHLPKTGGDATLASFQLFPELILFADTRDTERKHALFRDREDELPGRLLVMNMRRLPTWLLSRALHLARNGKPPDYKPMRMESPHEMAESSIADLRLSNSTDDGRFTIDRWLRMEFLTQDFLSFVSEFAEVTEEARQRVLELGLVNAKDYDHDLSHWFTEEQISKIYRNNPVWASIERQLYGDTLETKSPPIKPRACKRQ
jgi:hypothetical protein